MGCKPTKNKQGQVIENQYKPLVISGCSGAGKVFDQEKEIAKNVFAQYCQVHGNYYGTHKEYVNQIVKKGKIAILQIDLQGGSKVNASGLKCNYLFIDIPSLEVLRQRLVGRGTQTQETVNKRMKNAQGQLEQVAKLNYYHRIMNDQLDQCVKDVEQWLAKAYHLEMES